MFDEPRPLRLACTLAGTETFVAVRLWGPDDPRLPAVVCVHGLSRNAADFDALAAALAPKFRVACIDMPGRGASDRLADPTLYGTASYLAVAWNVIDRLELGAVHWVGTSMGGLLGLRLAAQAPARIRSLVLGDVGAELDGDELARQRSLAADAPSFADADDALRWLRDRYAAFGIRTEARWQHLLRTSTETRADGRVHLRFDVRAVPPAPAAGPLSLWTEYLALRCPVLVLRGAQSRLLSAATCERMAATGPRARWLEIPDAGHAPDLTGADRIGPVVNFLEHNA